MSRATVGSSSTTKIRFASWRRRLGGPDRGPAAFPGQVLEVTLVLLAFDRLAVLDTLLAARKAIENIAPPFGGLATFTCPPCSRTMPNTIANPNPVPTPAGLVVKNGSKIRPKVS